MWLIASASSNGIGLIPLFYIVSILGIISTGTFGFYKWQKSQRKQWQDEGMHAAKQAEALTANTEAALRNTEAISLLTGELRAFVSETRTQLLEQTRQIMRHSERIDRHNERIERLEDRRRSAGP